MFEKQNIWWFFRPTKRITIAEQIEIAKDILPNKNFWLGAAPGAHFIDTKDPSTLAFTKKDYELGYSDIERPIKEGDIVFVSHLYVLGGTISAIESVLQRLHSKHVELRIHSLSYADTAENNNYILLKNALLQIYNERARRVAFPKSETKKRRPGAPDRNIHYWTLTQEGRSLIAKYHDGVYSLKEIKPRLTNHTPDKKPIGRDMIYRLRHEYERYLLSRNQ